MASGKTLGMLSIARSQTNPKRLKRTEITASRDRSLSGKARKRARKEAQRAARESLRA